MRKVHAICLTQAGREGLLCRALESFFAQRQVDGRMTVITRDLQAAGCASRVFMEQLLDKRLVVVHEPTLGPEHLLRMAIGRVHEECDPEDLIVFWDDDNVCHPLRLARQLDVVKTQLPCYLSTAMWHFFDTEELFVYELEVRHRNLQERIIPCSMLAYASDVRVDDATWDGKGSPTTAIARRVQRRFNSVRLPGEFWWMKVGVRGDNAHGYEWHRNFAMTDRAMDVTWLATHRTLLTGWLDGYKLDPDPMHVCGRDGVAYRYTPNSITAAGMLPIGEPRGIERVTEFTPRGTDNE